MKGKGLRYKLLIIEALIFALPFLIISYILCKNDVSLDFFQLGILALILFLILVGLIILRQIFDRLFKVTSLMKNAVDGVVDGVENLTDVQGGFVDIQKDSDEMHEAIVLFNSLIKKLGETTKELRSRVFELFAIKKLTEVACKSLDIDHLLNVLLEKAMAVTKVQIGSAFMVHPEEGRFRIVTWKGLEPGSQEDAYLNMSESIAQHVLHDRKPFLIQDIGTDPMISNPNDLKFALTSCLSMPIFAREDVIGVLNLAHRETTEAFDSNDEQILSIMISEIGFALENAQLHSRVEEDSKNLEEHVAELAKTNDRLQQEITERRRAEEALKESSKWLEEKVEERTKELREAQDQLVCQGKLAILGQLAGGLGHELRNPLGAIRNSAYFLNMTLEQPGPKVKEALEILEKEVAVSERVISSLLDFARPKPPARLKVDINQVVQKTLSRVSVPENIEVVNQLDGTLPPILIDPDQFGQVFGNLILNAIQAMREGGRLIIKTSASSVEPSEAPSPEWVTVFITDTGIGMNKETLGKVFEPLFTTKARGIGLGLALTKILVEAHGGAIEVESEEGKGSTFRVRLPVG